MADMQISREKLLELLCEAYQAGCYGYLELKEVECGRILDRAVPEEKEYKGILPDKLELQLPPSVSHTVSVNPYSWPNYNVGVDMASQQGIIQARALMQSDHHQMMTGTVGPGTPYEFIYCRTREVNINVEENHHDDPNASKEGPQGSRC